MAAIVIVLVVVFAVATISEVHALSLWFFMMITHGALVEMLGGVAEHLPMYAGLIIMGITIARRKWTGIPVNTALLMFSLVAFIAMAAMWGFDPAHSTKLLILYSKGFVLAVFVGGVIKEERQFRIVTLYCLLAVFVGVCLAFKEHFTGTYSIDVYDIQRAAGLTGDPNDTAMLLLTGIPLALYWFTHSNKPSAKLMFAAVFILTIGAITLTQSRGGGVVLTLILFLIYLKRPTVKVLAIGAVLVFVGLLFAAGNYWERMETLSTADNSSDSSLKVRAKFVVTGIDAFLKNPVFGVGMGNYGRAIAEVSSDFDEDETHLVAHNMYLEFLVENGFIAGALFLALLIRSVMLSIRYDKFNEMETSAYGLGFCISMSLVAVMIAGLFLSLGKSSVLWFLVGIGLGFQKAIKLAKQSAESRPRGRLIDY